MVKVYSCCTCEITESEFVVIDLVTDVQSKSARHSIEKSFQCIRGLGGDGKGQRMEKSRENILTSEEARSGRNYKNSDNIASLCFSKKLLKRNKILSRRKTSRKLEVQTLPISLPNRRSKFQFHSVKVTKLHSP